jgi:hypothetical protein
MKNIHYNCKNRYNVDICPYTCYTNETYEHFKPIVPTAIFEQIIQEIQKEVRIDDMDIKIENDVIHVRVYKYPYDAVYRFTHYGELINRIWYD